MTLRITDDGCKRGSRRIDEARAPCPPGMSVPEFEVRHGLVGDS